MYRVKCRSLHGVYTTGDIVAEAELKKLKINISDFVEKGYLEKLATPKVKGK